MNTSTTAMATSTSKYNAPEFWERLWRMSGINFVVCVIIAAFVYGNQGDRTRILIAAVIAGMAILNLLWFVAALRTTLADAGRDGWGGAVIVSSGAVGVLFLLLIAVCAALAYVDTGSDSQPLASGMKDFAWAGFVLSSFPRAMLIMSGSFGLWRARLFSNRQFALGVAVLVLVLLGGTTWMSEGFWAPDGAYARLVSPALGLLWVLAVSRVLLTRSPATRTGW